MMPRNGQMPLDAAMSHALNASGHSADGAVLHRLAEEVGRMRTWMKREPHTFGQGSFGCALEAYELEEAAILRREQGPAQ